jgi:hypothetical protein
VASAAVVAAEAHEEAETVVTGRRVPLPDTSPRDDAFPTLDDWRIVYTIPDPRLEDELKQQAAVQARGMLLPRRKT